MEREGMTSSRFAEAIGIQRASMSHILNGRNNVSLDVLLKILERFTYINSDWLLFGKGELSQQLTQESPLFIQKAELNPIALTADSEYRQEIGVETLVNTPKIPVNEPIMRIEKPSKAVSKIMVFYSDHTFETFIPEKSKKE